MFVMENIQYLTRQVHSETHRSSGVFSELNDSRNGLTAIGKICK
jgi:hypothetical protein